jgi:co-chaperonin GroES (HSP10)
MLMQHEADPKQDLLDKVGDVSGFQVANNQVLCAVYLRPEKTKSGLYLSDATRDEDKHQSKVGLIIGLGPDAFIDPTNQWFNDMDYKLGDWIVYRPSDGWGITVNGVLCRMLDDTNLRGRVPFPDMVW